MTRWLLLVQVVLAAVLLAACDVGQSCNAAEPRCALDVALETSAWQPGTYEFELHADGAESRCTVELPLADGAWPTCSDGGEYFSWPPSFDEAATGAPRWVSFHTTPRRAAVVIRRDGAEIARQSFEPRYAVTEPNGEGCGICENADATMSF